MDKKTAEKRKRNSTAGFIKSPRGQAVITSILVFIVLLTLFIVASSWYEKKLQQDQEDSISDTLNLYENGLSQEIAERVVLVDGLSAFLTVASENDVGEDAIHMYLQSLYAGPESPHTLVATTEGQVAFVHPRERKEAVYTVLPEEWERMASGATSEEYTVTFTRSGTIYPGEDVLIISHPVTLNGTEGWVFFVGETDLLLSDAGIGEEGPGYDLLITDQKGTLILGDPGIIPQDPVTERAEFTGGKLTLAAVPTGGWGETTRYQSNIFFASGILMVIFVAFLVFTTLDNQGYLSEAVAERTRDLEEEIAERERGEEQIRILSQFREGVIDTAEIWINACTMDGKVILWNKAAEQISGFSRDRVLGGDGVWRHLIPDDTERNRLGGILFDTSKGEWIKDQNEVAIRCRSGEKKILQWNMKRLEGGDGTDDAVIIIARDVTYERKLEQQKEQALDQITRNMRQFAILNDQIRNPLQAILGIAELENENCEKRMTRCVAEINAIVTEIDRGYAESEKIHAFLKKHYGYDIIGDDPEDRH